MPTAPRLITFNSREKEVFFKLGTVVAGNQVEYLFEAVKAVLPDLHGEHNVPTVADVTVNDGTGLAVRLDTLLIDLAGARLTLVVRDSASPSAATTTTTTAPAAAGMYSHRILSPCFNATVLT